MGNLSIEVSLKSTIRIEWNDRKADSMMKHRPYCSCWKQFYYLFVSSSSIVCLHPRGLLRVQLSDRPTLASRNRYPGVYYTRDIGRGGSYLGYGDFLFYNLLILFVLPQSSSIIIKMCVTLGSILCVQVGYMTTIYLGWFYKQDCIPGLPLPVITVSIYFVILTTLMWTSTTNCVNVLNSNKSLL